MIRHFLFFIILGFAFRTQAADEIALVGVGDIWHFTNATTAHPAPRNWQKPSFIPQKWPQGGSGFGDTGYGENTLLKPLPGDWHNLLIRREFEVRDPAAIQYLSLRIDYDGGFVAWINGEEVIRQSISGAPGTPVPADTIGRTHKAGKAEIFAIQLRPGLLNSGTNLLAIQSCGDSYWSLRTTVIPELLANFTRAPYVQNIGTNRATLMWTTPVPLACTVEYGVEGQPKFTAAETSPTDYHVVTLTNLAAATAYNYRVVATTAAGTMATDSKTFRTFNTSGPLDVIVFGDSGGGSAGQFDLAKHMQDEKADMVLHMGDITYPTFVDGLADTKFLSVYRPLMRQIPFFFAWGNHDFDTSPDAFLHTIRQPISDVPLEQHQLERTLPQYYGSFDAGEVHFAILFQPFVYQYLMRTNGAQYQWLDRDLAQTRKPWKVLIAHQPFASSGLHGRDDTNFDGQRDQTQVDEMIMTLVRKHGVQLFLGGHDHDYERFLPTNGLYSVTTGGGGSVLYPLGSREAGSATFQSRYHFVRLHIDADEIQARTIGLGGEVFDRFAIRRTAPKAGEHQAAWYTPPMATGRADDGDGNVKHQHHDFGLAEPVVAKGGEFSNLGTLQVALDAKNLYIGLSGVMLPAGADIYLFLGMAGTPGVKGLAGLGNGRLDPNGEGADALDLAENLDFSGFEPTVAAIVGDEMADATIPSFRRAGSVMALGQGVFTLGKSFKPVHDARLQQYNQSPQELPDPAEQNADFIEIALPRESLPGLKDGAVLQIAGVAGAATDTARSIRFFDTGFLGESLSGYGMAKTSITPIKISLPEAPKP